MKRIRIDFVFISCMDLVCECVMIPNAPSSKIQEISFVANFNIGQTKSLEQNDQTVHIDFSPFI